MSIVRSSSVAERLIASAVVYDTVSYTCGGGFDPELSGRLRSLFAKDPVSDQVIGRAVRRGQLPPGAASTLAPLVHEVVEAQLLRQMLAGGELNEDFARHVVDDIVLPLLAGSVAQPGPAAKTTA
jgi:Tetracyclin repressor-like, C-terminal domain